MSKKSCAGCPRLKLIQGQTPPKDPEARNFWNTCPRQLDSMPDTPCSMGKPVKNARGRVVQEPACPWWIDSEKHNYCFWKFIQENSLPNGKMDSLLQNEIAQTFGCSSTKIHFIVKDAVQKLKASDKKGVLAELSSEQASDQEAEHPPLERLGLNEGSVSDEPEDT